MTTTDIILRIAQGYGYERGEAAMEFITALAIGKIRLHKEIDRKLKASIELALKGKVDDVELLLSGKPSPI